MYKKKILEETANNDHSPMKNIIENLTLIINDDEENEADDENEINCLTETEMQILTTIEDNAEFNDSIGYVHAQKDNIANLMMEERVYLSDSLLNETMTEDLITDNEPSLFVDESLIEGKASFPNEEAKMSLYTTTTKAAGTSLSSLASEDCCCEVPVVDSWEDLDNDNSLIKIYNAVCFIKKKFFFNYLLI